MLRGVPPNQPAYSFEKVKVLHSELRPRPLGTVVPQHTKALLERASTFIMKSPGELRMDGPCHINPYRDPVLRKSSKEFITFMVRLANQGLVSFRDHIKETVGLFCVKKKTPEWVRLILDARLGWSWALYFAQQAVSHIACGRVERPLTEVREKTPAPDISQQPCVGVYVTVDNIATLGLELTDVKKTALQVEQFSREASIPLTWSTQETKRVFQTVGMVIDFDEKQIIRNKPSRLWRAFLAGREILRHGRIAVKVLERWLGHMTAIFMIAPRGLSCFFHIQKFIGENRDRRAF